MATPAKAGRRETRGRLAFDMCFISNYLAKWSFSGPTDVKYFALRACMGWWVPGILNKSPKIGDRTCGAFARACQCWGDSGIILEILCKERLQNSVRATVRGGIPPSCSV